MRSVHDLVRRVTLALVSRGLGVLGILTCSLALGVFQGTAHAETPPTGAVEIFVFAQGSAHSGVSVTYNGTSLCTSDATGLCQLALPYGSYGMRMAADDNLEVVAVSRSEEVSPTAASDAATEIPVSNRGTVTVYVDWQPKPQGDAADPKGLPPALRYRVDVPLGPAPSTPSSVGPQGSGTPEAAQETKELRIVVRSLATGLAIGGVQVFVKGKDLQAKTNTAGLASFQLPPGQYDIALIHPDFTSATLRDVGVANDAATSEGTTPNTQATTVEASLSPASVALDELVVSAPHVRGSAAAFNEIRRESLEVNDVIGSEQMSKNGDSSAASALRRVTGLTLLDGKYIYVRGLGERYSSVTLNGSYLPSPEPMRRVVPLDIFPASILEGVVVQKTFTPDMPGEFGGGTLRLRTKRSFEGDRIKVSYGQSYALESGERLKGPQGKRDWTGFDDGTRALPKAIRKADRGKITGGTNGYSDAEIEAFGESFKRAYSIERESAKAWNDQNPEQSRALLGDNRSASAELRSSGELGVFRWGAYLSGLYGTGYEDGSYSLKRYNADSGKLTSIDKDLTTTYSKRKIDAGSLGHLRLGLGEGHSVDAISLLTRKTTDTAQLREGSQGSGDDIIRSTSLEWNERELFFNQFIGTHEFFDRFTIDWRYSQADARNYIPDARSYRYEKVGEEYLLSNRNDGNSRTFSTLVDLAEDWGVDATVTVVDWKPVVVRSKGGIASFYKKRDYEARRFFFQTPDGLDNAVRALKPEEILRPENISSSGFTLTENTRNTDTYRGRQILDAVYGQGEVSFGEWFALVAGARMEESRQQVLTYSLHDAGLAPEQASLNDRSVLPASNLTLRFGEHIQLRGAYSQTVSRPDLRELSTGSYYDDRLDIEVEGYPDLKTSDVRNIDARLEFYSGDTHRLSFGLFRKDIRRPIERVLLNVAGSDTKISYRNSKFARNEGFEVEMATGVEPFSLSTNVAFIESLVNLDLGSIGNQASLTSSKRPMQGVSPYIINVGFQFEPQNAPYQANLIYNKIGSRISELGTNGVPDVLEESRWTLDFVASYDLSEAMTMGLKLSDLVPQGTTTTQDGKVILKETGATSLAWSVSATF